MQMADESRAGARADTADAMVAQGRLLTLPMAAADLHIGLRTLHRLVHEGGLRTVTIGRRRFVTPRELDRYVAQLEHDGGAA
jgi:excisionase family DNA binding protein